MIVVSDNWCRMRMRPARLVSYAFLYTTDMVTDADKDTTFRRKFDSPTTKNKGEKNEGPTEAWVLTQKIV